MEPSPEDSTHDHRICPRCNPFLAMLDSLHQSGFCAICQIGLAGAAPDLYAERLKISETLTSLNWSTPERAEKLLQHLVNDFSQSPAVAKAQGE
ncbi:MAG: hypothetical protein V3S54_09270 [Woeseiaceae bacterium]